ncbi:universal stress protein [Sinosporangium siamense]|uniref:Universal stress protein n=1 Tax=Sinosporangium siamense TaxID=1367973 RepID=A0A919RAW5_9ACTN|nr:universal stress protein [Sinosporangium siamense]GII90262.1 universal stress protein [Sinosporangium siamense]
MKLERILTGFIPEPRGRDGLALAVLIARQSGAALTVANVHPPAWETPGPGKVDAEWRTYLREQAQHTLDVAGELLAGQEDVSAEFVMHPQRGSGRGLSELARATGADLVVVGSAPRGARGRISLSSTADQLLHASPVPVALAPKGYAASAPAAFDRITVAYRRGPGCDHAVRLAAKAAAIFGVPLRLVTLVLRGGGRPGRVEDAMLERLREQVLADLRAVARGPRRSTHVDLEVLSGRDVASALASTSWFPGEMVMCASSEEGPLRRVFLGDTSLKIIRAAPCPVIILPRVPAMERTRAVHLKR